VEGTARKRPWLAALLAFVHPGLGHVYLREWARALLWFALVLTSASLLIPEAIVPETFSLEALRTMSREMPVEAVLVLAGITVLSMVDAYWVASRNNQASRETETGVRCPNCGREVDETIDFCHWCTTRLDAAEETDATANS
jgi:predicted RNA-binding Zn-ribbon protein involved in translation (DUF1610 family)